MITTMTGGGGVDTNATQRTVALHLGKVASTCLLLGCNMEEEPMRIRDLVNLLHMLGFPSREGGGRVGVEELEENDGRAMTNAEPKSGAVGDDGRRG